MSTSAIASSSAVASSSASIEDFKWPEDLASIRVTPEEKDKIEEIARRCLARIGDESGVDWLSRRQGAPRKVYVTVDHNLETEVVKKHAFIILTCREGMGPFENSGHQQKKIKVAWDCLGKGGFWLLKRCYSIETFDCIGGIACSGHFASLTGALPGIVPNMESRESIKYRKINRFEYFEEKYGQSLIDVLERRRSIDPSLKSMIRLILFIAAMHKIIYRPADFVCLDCKTSIGSAQGPWAFFHGDISPNNVLCKETKKNKFKFKWTDFFGLASLYINIRTPGWGSPEYLAFITKTNYCDMHLSQFLRRYGTKKDVWGVGLLLVLLLQNGELPKNSEGKRQMLPNLPCLLRKIKFDKERKRFEDRDLLQLTQEEIDWDFDLLMRDETPERLPLWQCAKKCLTIDPDERPDLSESLPSEEELSALFKQ